MRINQYVRNRDVFETLVKLNFKFDVYSVNDRRAFSFTVEMDNYRNEYSGPNIIIELNCEKASQYKVFKGFNRIDFTIYDKDGFSEQKKKQKIEQLAHVFEKKFIRKAVFNGPEYDVVPSVYYEYQISDKKEEFYILAGDPRNGEKQLTFSIRDECKRRFDKDNISSFKDYFNSIILLICSLVKL